MTKCFWIWVRRNGEDWKLSMHGVQGGGDPGAWVSAYQDDGSVLEMRIVLAACEPTGLTTTVERYARERNGALVHEEQ